jgi:uncharacterized membrane protein
MNQNNPYQPPATTVEATTSKSDDVWAFVEPQKVSMGRGLGWIGDGFRSFGRNPGIWIAITIVYLIIVMVSSFIPFATNILMPMLAGGLMIGIHDQDNGEELEVKHLFDGFENAAGKLAILGAILLAVIIAVMIVMLILFFIGVGITVSTDQSHGPSPTVIITLFSIGVPIMLVVSILYMAISWFGPPLIALHDLSVGEAFKMSMLGVKRNILPFIVFTFFMMILFMLSILTLYLGFLVTIPVMMAATYASWKDIYTQAGHA